MGTSVPSMSIDLAIRDPEIREAFERGREAVAIGWAWATGQRALDLLGPNKVATGVIASLWNLPGEPGHLQPLGFLRDDRRGCSVGVRKGIIVPDFRDPGTRGHLLDQVRKAYGCPNASVYFVETLGEWCCELPMPNGPRFHRLTETGALLAARKAAA